MRQFVVALLAFSFLTSTQVMAEDNALKDNALKDMVVLSNGARLHGKVTELEIDGKKYVVVELESGLTMKMRRNSIAQLRLASTRMAEYEALVKKSTDDVSGHWQMATWCKENLESGGGSGRLSPQREYHLQKIVRLDPKHSDARKMLGFRQVDGQWVHRDHFPAQHGMIKRGSRWYTKQEIMIQEMNEKDDEKYKWWRSELKKQRSRQTKLAEYRRTLATVDNKFAAVGLIERYKDEKDLAFKTMTLDAIGRLDSAKSRNFLVDTAILDPLDRFRDRAVSLLNGAQFSKSRSANRAAAIMSQTKDNDVVNRAAYVIGQLKQESTILPLIKSLKTTHEYIVGPNGNMHFSFGSNGTGISPGQKKERIKRTFDNQNVLSSLTIITGQNFEFNETSWMKWYISKYSVERTDLRRDE